MRSFPCACFDAVPSTGLLGNMVCLFYAECSTLLGWTCAAAHMLPCARLPGSERCCSGSGVCVFA